MLIEFRVKNFYSIQDEQVFSLVASSQKEHKNNTFTLEKDLSLLKSAAIYGANAAGKTNLIKAFSAMEEIVLKSAKVQRGEKLPTLPFLLGDDKDEVSEFELSFAAKNNIKYTYGFSSSQEQIFNEWLFAYPNGRKQTIFTREFDEKTGQYIYEDRNLSGRKKFWEDSTRENALFLSTAILLNSQQLKPVFDWFLTNNISGIGGFTFRNSLDITIDVFKKQAKELLECLKAVDLDIETLKIDEEEISLQDLPTNIPNETIEMLKKSQNNKIRRVDIKTIHLNQQGKAIDFDINLESDGTRQFFALLGPILDTLDKGKILIIDELDKHFHPAMTKFIINLFHNEKINKKNAQLIFTTHETSILHKDIFRKDQICFCEKQNKASKFYSLSDFKGLRDIDYEKSYLLGRFGALPNLREI